MREEPISEESVTAEVGAELLDPLVDRTLDGRFRIVGVIGKGAMGRVYRAVQVPLNRPVALKVLDSRYGAGRDESFRQRFLVEAALTARLSHPNTVRVLDYGQTADGLFYLAMEYLDGDTLERVLKQHPLGWRRALHVGQQLARALKEAHSLGVVHRDLKPGNVMMLNADDDTDHVKVLDFGLVKSFIDGRELEGRAITQQGMLMGSPPYMAPEQGERNRADPRSDIYSLGVVLFECLTGKPPFTGNAPLEIILKHVHQPVPPLLTPTGFEPVPALMKDLVSTCLAKSPMDRFQSMDEVLSAMQALTQPRPAPLSAQPPSGRALNRVRARGQGWATLLVGFALALAVGIGGTVLVMRARAPAEPTVQAPVPAAPEPEPTVVYRIETEPPGALTAIDGKSVGVTPFELERPATRSDVEFSLTLPGYLPLRVRAGGQGPRVELRQRLQPIDPPVADSPAEPPEVKPVRTAPARPTRRHPAKQASNKVIIPEARPAAKLDEEDDPTLIAPPPTELKRPASLRKQPGP